MRFIKKRVIILFTILTLMFTVNVFADELIPNNVIRNDLENGSKEIIKVYELSSKDEFLVDVNDFSEDETIYKYLVTNSNEILETEEKNVTHEIQVETPTNDRNVILSKYDLSIEYKDNDHFTGEIQLDLDSLNTKVKGYTTKYYKVYENRSYPNLPTNDVAYIPKTINANGYTYTSSNISWVYNSNFAENSIIPETYTANVTYEATTSSQNATGYITTALYKGVVSKVTKDVTEYEVVFRSDENVIEETVDVTAEDKAQNQDGIENTENNSKIASALKVVLLILFIALLILIYVKFLHSKVLDKIQQNKLNKQIKENMLNDVELSESVDEYFNNSESEDDTDNEN